MISLDKAWVTRLAFMFAAGLSLIEPAVAAESQARAVCDSQTGVAPSRLATLARGFNLTGWLDSASPRAPDEKALAGLLRRGFTHIRLPVTPETISTAFSSPDQVAAQLKMLDHAIDW